MDTLVGLYPKQHKKKRGLHLGLLSYMNPFGAMIVFNITFKGFKIPWFGTPNDEDRISANGEATKRNEFRMKVTASDTTHLKINARNL